MKKLFSVMILLTLSSAGQADVYYKSGYNSRGAGHVPTITISGEITPNDVNNFKALLAKANENSKSLGMTFGGGGAVQINLDSQGGDLASSLMIGKMIRDFSGIATVGVNKESKCVSSCVFVLAGAPRRTVKGMVGIHRPYLRADTETTVVGQKAAYANMENVIKKYLDSMNVPTNLYDQMIRIPPENVRWLTQGELQSYGLSEDDPYYHEADTSRLAERFGLSKQEYLDVLAESDSVCRQAPPKCFFDLIVKKRNERTHSSSDLGSAHTRP